MCNKWTIIYFYHDKPIHYHHLIKSNPNANILLGDISNNYNKHYCWRNCDNLFRKWIKNNLDQISTNNIAILEWDVLVSCKLPDININGLFGKDVITRDQNWVWFRDCYKLSKYKNYAIGLSPLAVLFMDKITLTTWTSDEFDAIYTKDIFSELRLPTLLNSKNISINSFPMNNVDWRNIIKYNSSIPDIYHPIKYHV